MPCKGDRGLRSELGSKKESKREEPLETRSADSLSALSFWHRMKPTQTRQQNGEDGVFSPLSFFWLPFRCLKRRSSHSPNIPHDKSDSREDDDVRR